MTAEERARVLFRDYNVTIAPGSAYLMGTPQDFIASLFRAAVAEERERCAKIAEDFGDPDKLASADDDEPLPLTRSEFRAKYGTDDCAAAIRALP